MNKLPYEDLDDIIFELNESTERKYHMLVDGPIDNKTFLRNAAIGASMLLAIPILVIIIVTLMGH